MLSLSRLPLPSPHPLVPFCDAVSQPQGTPFPSRAANPLSLPSPWLGAQPIRPCACRTQTRGRPPSQPLPPAPAGRPRLTLEAVMPPAASPSWQRSLRPIHCAPVRRLDLLRTAPSQKHGPCGTHAGKECKWTDSPSTTTRVSATGPSGLVGSAHAQTGGAILLFLPLKGQLEPYQTSSGGRMWVSGLGGVIVSYGIGVGVMLRVLGHQVNGELADCKA